MEADEKLICSSEQLAAADARLAAVYRQLRETIMAPDRERLAAQQRDWIVKRRQACAVHGHTINADRTGSAIASCAQAYVARIADLSEQLAKLNSVPANITESAPRGTTPSVDTIPKEPTFKDFATARQYVSSLPPTTDSLTRLDALMHGNAYRKIHAGEHEGKLGLRGNDLDFVLQNDLYGFIGDRRSEIEKVLGQQQLATLRSSATAAAQAASTRIDSMGLKAEFLNGQIMIGNMVGQHVPYLTVRQWLALVLTNPKSEMVAHKSDWDQPGIVGTEIEYKMKTQRTAGFIFELDGQDVFLTHRTVNGLAQEDLNQAGAATMMLIAGHDPRQQSLFLAQEP